MMARSVVVLVLSAAATGCTFGGDDPAADEANGADATAVETNGDTEAKPLEFQIEGGSSEIYCDNTERMVGEISGAEPGERIELSSPQPIQLSDEQVDATADADGAYRLMWRCDPSQAGQPWELRVHGDDSGRWATVSFVGTAIDPDPVDTLQITLLEDTFLCDGSFKDLGELSNAGAFERVVFTAARADDLVDDRADEEGHMLLTWQCSPGEAGTWEVTARGDESGRVGQFTIVGRAPTSDEIPTPTVLVDEDPFVCDGGSRVFATLSAFLPDEVVKFSSPHASDLADGQADGSGDLPIRWTCGAADAGTVWELTATGDRSERTVSFTVTGAEAPASPDPSVSFTENPFRCDGGTRFYATITGFAPREFVDFTSPQTENLRQGQADETGGLPIRWTCDAGQSDQIWDVTATGATSQRSVSFQITGAAP